MPSNATRTPSPDGETARRIVVARVVRLGEAGASDDLSDVTTASERVELVQVLSRRMWELTGRPWPDYPRSAMPGRVVRRATRDR